MTDRSAPDAGACCCQYPNKRCKNRRTTKRDGGLHRFCAMHRAQANRNQKRWLEQRLESYEPQALPLDTTTSDVPVIDSTPLDLAIASLWQDLLTALATTTSPCETVELRTDDAMIEYIDDFLRTEGMAAV